MEFVLILWFISRGLTDCNGFFFFLFKNFFFLVDLMHGDQDDKVRVVQTLLFVEGINTLLQTLFGTRLPTVVGGSYAFMVPIISIIHDSSLMEISDPHQVCFIFYISSFFSLAFAFSDKSLTPFTESFVAVQICVGHLPKCFYKITFLRGHRDVSSNNQIQNLEIHVLFE